MAKTKMTTPYKRCADTHPLLTIKMGSKAYQISGGNCTTQNKMVLEADVFVGLDAGMTKTNRRYPWTAGEEFSFLITDMSVPASVPEFKQLLNYLQQQVMEGKLVHVGCIGGHGRTGLVLSALVNQMTGMADSTTYVRDNYCKKAVESEKQVEWLHTHFGIKKVEPTKTSYLGSGWKQGSRNSHLFPTEDHSRYLDPIEAWESPSAWSVGDHSYPQSNKPKKTSVRPVKAQGQIHGGNL
jgi:hypothetical protein